MCAGTARSRNPLRSRRPSKPSRRSKWTSAAFRASCTAANDMDRDEAYRKLTPGWASWGSRLPAFGHPLLCWIVGAWWFVTDIAKGRVPHIEAIRQACKVGSFEAWRIFFMTRVHHALNLLHFASFVGMDDAALGQWAAARTTVINADRIDEALDAGRPVILLLVSFALHYPGLINCGAHQRWTRREVCVVQPEAALGPLTAIGFYERLSRVSGRRIYGVQADSQTVAIKVARAVGAGALIAMRVDSLPTQTPSFVESTLCGRPSMFPLNLLALASKLGAELIPFSVVREGTRFITQLHEPSRLTSGATADDYTRVAAELDACIGRLIRANPGQYTAWSAVAEKWRMAREIQEHLRSGNSHLGATGEH